MNAVLANVRQLVDVELAAANERFPQFHSQHEGWAVLKRRSRRGRRRGKQDETTLGVCLGKYHK